MKFELIPILDFIEDLYNKPRSQNRFKEYLFKLQGNSKDGLDLPIMGFNPMGKEHALQKIEELKYLEAEDIIRKTLNELNSKLNNQNSKTIKVVLNLADNLGGAWTNRYATDFDSKFKINALVARNFCTPYFWTSESYHKALVKKRTLEYAYRTVYWLENVGPSTLEDHVKQEIFVHKQIGNTSIQGKKKMFDTIQKFYEAYRYEDEYSVLFNFFYGDAASSSLGYPTYGIKEVNGFDYAKKLAS
ncbi:hypothetical protein U6A24_12375 [Aquimarina gracilis]|uniref:Uncharacterized protein n=1 Tax=Aquimarina gracilis TaxID=874422 RepID=A0ABU5ZWM0_9FLAO|nr:hypothetical protein [Aquimarina gracilis]MEB3346265.1 hypothetical protein [Aquimarina gracilis]